MAEFPMPNGVDPQPKPRRGKGGDRPAVDVGRLFDRVPPHNLQAERSLLGSVLLDPRVLDDVIQVVRTKEAFYKEAHGAIYQALLDTYDARQTGDLVQLAELLNGRGVLERVGGAEYLMELAESVPSTSNAVHYARLVSDSARLRKLIDAAGQILYDAYHEGQAGVESTRRVIDVAEKRIFDIAQEDDDAEAETLRELLLAELERIDKADGKAVSGLPTGFDEMDKMLSGLQKGEMLILAARPSMGKTALALNLTEQIAFGGADPWKPKSKNKPTPVGIFSLEMSRQSLVQRLISARSGIDAHRLRIGSINADEWDKLQSSCNELAEAPIYIDDTPGMTILQLRAKARRMKQRHQIECVVIDYLQLLTSPTSARESRQVEVSEISRGIKSLARELKLPVVCLAQLNRGAEQREGNRPRMSDLRESGSIEQDADVVMLLHREAYYHRGDPAWDPESPEFDETNRDKLNLSEIIVAKQRNGPTGTVRLVWDGATTRFKNYDEMHSGGWDSQGGGHGGGGHGYGGGGGHTPSPAPRPAVPRAAARAPIADEPFTSFGEPEAPRGSLPEPGARSYSFQPGKKTGPVEQHRDGGGPDRDEPIEFGRPAAEDDSDLEPPF